MPLFQLTMSGPHDYDYGNVSFEYGGANVSYSAKMLLLILLDKFSYLLDKIHRCFCLNPMACFQCDMLCLWKVGIAHWQILSIDVPA